MDNEYDYNDDVYFGPLNERRVKVAQNVLFGIMVAAWLSVIAAAVICS